MFNFIKKGSTEKDEKEKRKKEKEGKKKRERIGMTAEELLRLDEMRRSLKIRSRRKEKEKLPSGITADYSENFLEGLERDPECNKSTSLPGHAKAHGTPSLIFGEVSAQSDSSEASLNSFSNQATHKVLPPLPPRPPKRGILKGSRTNMHSNDCYDSQDPSSINLLAKNTMQNELITYQNVPSKTTNGMAVNHKTHSSPEHQSGSVYLSAGNDRNNLLSVVSTSPSAESLTDTTNSSFATPPFSLSPVGENQGFGKLHSSIDDKTLDLPLPSIIPIQLPKPRELTIHRTAKGDFGFQLRRAIITDKLSCISKKTVVFAEPGAIVGNRNDTGLLPGDILLEVNGIQVHDKSREEIIDLIKSSGSSVMVKVQPIPELCELSRRSGLDGQYVALNDSNIRGGTLKRSGSLRFKKTTAKTEEELSNEKAWLTTERMWLVHKGGFTAVKAMPASNDPSSEGKVKVKVENTNEILEVDDDDLEKANPPQLDKVEDICHLRYINESSVLYILRQRFGNNLIHTYAAGNLIVLNPQCTLYIYNEKVAALFRGCKSEDMPPHIYAMAQTTYRSMLSTRKDQSIVLLGRSGSGKTHNFRQILSYLLHSAGSLNKVLNIEKLNALHTVLEAFGNAKTCLNVNATRCTNLISLDFDQTGQIASLSLQMLMLEKQRVARRPDGEGTFNVFYWLLAGAEGSLAKQLLLDSSTQSNNLFINSLHKNEDRQRAVMELSKLSLALKALGINEKECFVIWSILAAIYHLGNAGTVRVGTNKWQFADPVHSSKACRLLGTTTEELCQTIWNSPTSPSRTPSPTDKDKTLTGVEALEGFVIGLYSELVNIINNLINRCLTTSVHSTISFVLVDSPGVQNPASCGQQRGGNFNELCHNYVQERLQLLFHNVSLVAPHDRYTQEHIDVNTDEIYAELNSPNQLVNILDKSPPSGVLKTSQTDLREIDRRGLLWLLDEESLYPNSSDETFIERLFQHYGGKDHQMFIRKSGGSGHFVIQHFQGTNPVTYNANGFLKASRENPVTRSVITFLQESTKEDISELFVKAKGGLLASGAESSQSLRRVSSIRRTCSVAVKRKSISLQVKFTTDSLIETLRRTRTRFVFCMLPHHNAGNTEIIPGPATGENALNIPLLRSQIRGAEILPSVRMFKQGFPEYFSHGEFRRRFRLLASGNGPIVERTKPSGVEITINGQPSEALDEARAVEEMLLQMDVDVTSYRIGLSQIFFRAGILAQLESQRDEKLADLIIQLQSRCRGYLARKKLAKLKVQDLAVRCIQRNVRKLMQVREWPWWRLYVKVTPLLNIHRTEEELTAKIQELESLKATLEKVEGERNQLKLENDKLEAKLSHEAKEKFFELRRRNMEKNLSFFEAWRAKRKEKKNEEAAAATAAATSVPTTTKSESVLAKYLRLREQETSIADALPSEKSENASGVDKIKSKDLAKGQEKLKNGAVEPKPSETAEEKKKEATIAKTPQSINDNAENVSSKELEKVIQPEAASKEVTSSLVKRKSSDANPPINGKRSSFSVSSESNSRRNSFIMSPLSSISNIQEKLQSFSKENETVKKPIKVNKLSEGVFKIGKEPLKTPKVEGNSRTKIFKMGVEKKISDIGSQSGSSNNDETIKKTVEESFVNSTETVTILSKDGHNEQLVSKKEEDYQLQLQKVVLEKPASVSSQSGPSNNVDTGKKTIVEKPLVGSTKSVAIVNKDSKTEPSTNSKIEGNSQLKQQKLVVEKTPSVLGSQLGSSNSVEAVKKTTVDKPLVESTENVSKDSKAEPPKAAKLEENSPLHLQKVVLEKAKSSVSNQPGPSDNVEAFKKTTSVKPSVGSTGTVTILNQEKNKTLTTSKIEGNSVLKLKKVAVEKATSGVSSQLGISSKVDGLKQTTEAGEKTLVKSNGTLGIVSKDSKSESLQASKEEGNTQSKLQVVEKAMSDVSSQPGTSNVVEKGREVVEKQLVESTETINKDSKTVAGTLRVDVETKDIKTFQSITKTASTSEEKSISQSVDTEINSKTFQVSQNVDQTSKNAAKQTIKSIKTSLLKKTAEKSKPQGKSTSKPEQKPLEKISKTSENSTVTQTKLLDKKKKSELLAKEAIKVTESLTEMTKQIAEDQKTTETKKTEPDDESTSESISLRKNPKKLVKKLKVKSSPNECYPETQKLLTNKPVNAFEQANMEESKCGTIVSPTKVEAFLREALSPPIVAGSNKDPVKTMEAVVEEILTSTSEKSKHEKPIPKPSQVKYSSRGEVILGSVSIKPSNKIESSETSDTLSAITLVPAFRPEKSIFDEKAESKEESCYSVKEQNLALEPLEEQPERAFERERSPFSPFSDFSDDSYDHYVASIDYSLDSSLYSRRRSTRSSSTPRRIFPQVVTPSIFRGFKAKEDSPVVFDASLSFDLSSNRSSLRHRFKPQPAFTELKTNSSLLSLRIADFLKRTDHIMDEWKNLGKGSGNDLQSLVELPSKRILGQSSSKCKSATNIMIKGLLNYSKGSRGYSIRSRSTAENSDRTMSDIDELSEMTMDLTEERAASTTMAERLEAETAERVKLEQELSEIQSEKKNLQQASEKLEMELFYARADVNGLSESEADLEDGGGDAALYKNKCERAMRELEFTRRRLQQQHEDDLEQLVGLKKQLEKKLTDAYEEVEEQRQVAGQWKRKVQKVQSEMSDLRLLLEEQSSRNNLLEKKQRKFDSEIQMLQEELRSEKNQKERLSREKEMAYAEKYSLEQNLSSVRLELELKEEKIAALTRELEEFGRGGSEQEMTQLRKLKHDLEMKLKEQEEELDELAGQVSMLEGNKLRLEMSLESLRKEHRREMAQRDDELDEARANAQKKIKILESQLESEHEERTLLVREKHELERRLADAEERGRHYRAADEDALLRARRDLKKTKALLRDAQVMLERAKQDSPSKAALRALKNQLEDAELARASAVKARQSLESELNEVNGQLEEALRAKGDAENRCQAALRETNALRMQVDENEEELAELLKKYRQTVQQLSAEQLANQETAGTLAEVEAERTSLRDQLAELTARLEANTIADPMSGIAQKKLEIRIKELESRLELEQTTRGRLEVQITRLKENVERLNEECVQARTKEQAATDLTRKLQRSLREAKEELTVQQAKEQEAVHKRKELEKKLETAEHEASTARTDLRLAVKRIEDLQSAISGEIGSDSERSESDEEDSGDDSIISHVPSTLSSTSRTSRTPDLTPR